MHKSTSIIILSIFLSINVFAQKMEKQLYSEDIVIVDETDKKLAHINVYGKVTLLDGVESADVINMLIRRSAEENARHTKEIKQAKILIEKHQKHSYLVLQQANKIIELYRPPAPPAKKEVKKEVKKEEPKKKRWSWFTRNKGK